MAFQSSDGKKFTNRPPMMQHNKSLERGAQKSQGGGAGVMTDPTAQPGMGGDMEQGGEDPHAVMEQHGPAMQTHTEHPPEGQEGPHMAHSMHPDGHDHRSEHGDGKSAHQHAMCLSGHCDCGGGESEGGEHEPEFE